MPNTDLSNLFPFHMNFWVIKTTLKLKHTIYFTQTFRPIVSNDVINVNYSNFVNRFPEGANQIQGSYYRERTNLIYFLGHEIPEES